MSLMHCMSTVIDLLVMIDEIQFLILAVKGNGDGKGLDQVLRLHKVDLSIVVVMI